MGCLSPTSSSMRWLAVYLNSLILPQAFEYLSIGIRSQNWLLVFLPMKGLTGQRLSNAPESAAARMLTLTGGPLIWCTWVLWGCLSLTSSRMRCLGEYF
jgi:hypothetical protein